MHKNSLPLPAMLQRIVEQQPSNIALQIKLDSGYNKITYQELLTKSHFIAQNLLALNIKPGDKVAIILENRPEWPIIYFAITLAGCIAVPLDPQATIDDLTYCLQDAAVTAVFATSNRYSELATAFNKIASLQHLITIPSLTAKDDQLQSALTLSSLLAEPANEVALPNCNPDNLASIIYTSGTTGKPKGVMLTHANFIANIKSAEKVGLIVADDNIISILPLHHSFPFTVTMLVPLLTGAKITYIQTLRTDELLSCMREANVTGLVAVPQLYLLIAEQIKTEINKIKPMVRWPLMLVVKLFALLRRITGINLNKKLLKQLHQKFGSKLRFFGSGGAKLKPEVTAFLTKLGFTVYEGYGLTETAPVVTFNPIGKTKIGSAGKPLPGVTVKIDQPNSDGIGEILVQGDNVMQGYYHLPAETAEVIKDGWFYTGDLGYLDQDNYLFITGRKKEIIVLSSGKNIAPDEVENHYAQSPYIKELAVMAIGDDDETLKAVIVPDTDYFRRKGLVNIQGLIKWDLENLSKEYPAYKRIAGFTITNEDLPRTRLGKLRRFLIRDKYLPELSGQRKSKQDVKIELSPADQQLIASDLAKNIYSVIASTKKLDEIIQLDSHLELDLGFDSLHRIELFAALEQHFNIKFPEVKMAHIFTVRELIETIANLMPNNKIVSTSTKQKDFSWHDVLSQEPQQEIIDHIALADSKKSIRYTKLLVGTIHLLGRLYWRLDGVNVKNLPLDEPLLFCANHASYLDGGFIGATLPDELIVKTFFIGYRGYFSGKIMRWFSRNFRIIGINQASELVDALQASAHVLKKGKSICIFPAGTRSIDGKVQEFRKGIGILGKELNVKMVPIYVDGTYESLSRRDRFPKPHKVNIIYGEPQTPAQLEVKGKELGATDAYEAITLAMHEEIVKLIP